MSYLISNVVNYRCFVSKEVYGKTLVRLSKFLGKHARAIIQWECVSVGIWQ